MLKAIESLSTEMFVIHYGKTDEKETISRMLDSLLNGKQFENGIDIGAGNGSVTAPIHSRCRHLDILDIVKHYNDVLAFKFPDVNIINTDVLDYNFEKKYDIILFSHVLYYLPEEQWATITEKLYQQLNRNGLLILIHMKFDPMHLLFEKISKHYGYHYMLFDDFKAQLSNLPKPEIYSYDMKTFFRPMDDIRLYLTNLFRLDDDKYLDQCADEIDQFKARLIEEDNIKYLPGYNEIMIFKKSE